MKRVIILVLTLGGLLITSIGTIQSNAQEPAKNNTYYASSKIAISNIAKQNILNIAQASELAQISANKAKQEEIDRIAVERGYTSKQAKIASDKSQQKAAGVENVNRAKIESAILATVGRDQTITEAKLSTYLSSSANISSVLNKAVVLHGGNASNTCVYFSSQAMREIGVAVPVSTCNTRQYLSYLRAHAWISSGNIEDLALGSICFTTNGWDGYPTHTFVFMGWVTAGDYSLAYVADNQGNSVHVRNMGATDATDAFAFFMRTPPILAPTPATVAQTLYGVTTSSTSVRTGAHVNYSVYATMPAGYKMAITGVAGTFYRVTYNNKTGYVSNSDVTLITLEPTPVTVALNLYGVTTSSTSVRTGAHVNYSVYATMPAGYKMAITGVAGTFYRVTYNNKTGYVSSSTVILTAKPVVVTPVKVISVSLNKTTDTLIAGDTDNLTSTITPNNAVNKGVTWKSSDASIATVDNTGKITAVSAGTATITVTTIDGSKTATCIYKINNSIDNNTIITSKFTDPNFKTQVYSLIGKSSSDPILYSDVKNITTLSLNMLNISNLSGIEYFTGLITLGCFGNQLTTLDLSKNTALTYLNCSYNNLTSLYCNKKLVLSGYVSYRPQYTDLTHTRTVDNLVITIK